MTMDLWWLGLSAVALLWLLAPGEMHEYGKKRWWPQMRDPTPWGARVLRLLCVIAFLAGIVGFIISLR